MALIEAWNRRSAADFGVLFEENGAVIGFDGSQMQEKAMIQGELEQIFREHVTAPYVTKIQSVRFLSADVAQVYAIAGMIPPGQSELNPALNTLQTLTAVRGAAGWRIAFYQNTPAQFHGRPVLVKAMTDELKALL